jgi:hypothetical protein
MRYNEPTLKEQIMRDNITCLTELIKESEMTDDEKQSALFMLGTISGLAILEKE